MASPARESAALYFNPFTQEGSEQECDRPYIKVLCPLDMRVDQFTQIIRSVGNLVAVDNLSEKMNLNESQKIVCQYLLGELLKQVVGIEEFDVDSEGFDNLNETQVDRMLIIVSATLLPPVVQPQEVKVNP